MVFTSHKMQIHGGRWTDLMRIVTREIFYQMQHPVLLDLFVEPTAGIHAHIQKDSALFVVDVDEKSLRIQRPLGPQGPRLFEAEIRKEYGKRGILAAGMDAGLAQRLTEICPTANKPIEQNVEFSDLDAFDLSLQGSLYKTLRASIHHAEREGIAVEPYDARVHGARALKVFEEWNSLKPRIATFWIPRILDGTGQFPEMIAVVACKQKKILGVSIALAAGAYAYMLLALTLSIHGRAQELMDYELIKTLKSAGVRRLDWGISDGGPISAYKKKYGGIARVPIWTVWIPAKT